MGYRQAHGYISFFVPFIQEVRRFFVGIFSVYDVLAAFIATVVAPMVAETPTKEQTGW